MVCKVDKYLLKQSFKKGTIDSNLYFKVEKEKFFIVVYVDGIIFGGDDDMFKKFAEEM